ncbi:MAG: hypothetical protein WAO71_10420 [Gallionella sp.]
MSKIQFKAAQSSAPVIKRLYVIDTSYLLELYRVHPWYEESAHRTIKQKFEENYKAGQFFVPVAVLFELANHIADAKLRRFELAAQLSQDVASSISAQSPWTITHAVGAQSLADLVSALNESVSRFADEFSRQELGLTDTTVILEAERLLRKDQKLASLRHYQVHIWTRHAALKAREPDAEPSPFI